MKLFFLNLFKNFCLFAAMMVVLTYACLVGSLGTYSLFEVGWIDVDPMLISKGSLLIGYPFGVAVVGYLAVRWMKDWPEAYPMLKKSEE